MANGVRTLTPCFTKNGVLMVPLRSPAPKDTQWKTARKASSISSVAILEYTLFSSRMSRSITPPDANIPPTAYISQPGLSLSGCMKQRPMPTNRKITPISTGGLSIVTLPSGCTVTDDDSAAPGICARAAAFWICRNMKPNNVNAVPTPRQIHMPPWMPVSNTASAGSPGE